jgi:hypothetical protein
MMGVVTQYLASLIATQVEERSLVVWYDPDQSYPDAAAALEVPNAKVVCYDGSYIQLRHDIDQLLKGQQPPRLVVYVPHAQPDTHHALIELEAAGVVMQPGQQPPPRNTRLAIVARNALKPLVGEENAAEYEKQVEAGQRTLTDLDQLGALGEGLSTAGLTLVYGTGNPQDVARLFLTDPSFDPEVERKDATPELIRTVETTFDCTVPKEISLEDLREVLARHVLATDLISTLGEAPASLASVPVAHTPVGVDQCCRLARSWRNDRTVRDSYVMAATNVARWMSLEKCDFNPTRLANTETFLEAELFLVRHVEKAMSEGATPDLLTLAQKRLSRFWAEADPMMQSRWALVAAAAEVMLEATRVGKAIRTPPDNLPDLIKAYTDGDSPWCLLDTHHRHMESRRFGFEFKAGDEHEGLDRLCVKAEQRYMEVGSTLAKVFVTQFSKTKHPVKELLRQRECFEKVVKPRLGHKKVGYVWVDALRFEMARELCRLLKTDYEVEIQPAVGTPPTITEIGMAALLPRAHESAKVVAVGNGKVGLEINGTLLKDRKDRVAYLQANAGVSVYEAKLEDLLPLPKKKVRDGIAAADLVLVTSQEIDELCEKDNVTQARLQMDGVLEHLRRAIRVLVENGVESLVLVADHGHLFVEEVGDDMKLDPPGGEAADLHRRVWVGNGGTSSPGYLRAPLASLGVDSDLDLATPWTFAVFKAKGGARSYFHGGLSPQEVIVPVITLTATSKPQAPKAGITWTLSTGRPKITTRFLSVDVSGQQSGLFPTDPPRVRLEIRANKAVVSKAVSASYGFEDSTGDVVMRTSAADPNAIEKNTVALMIQADEIKQNTVSLVLLDASSGVELAKLENIEVAISM